MSDSEVVFSRSATTFAGPDAVALFQAVQLRSAINMYVETGGRLIPTRGVTITKMLAFATRLTGQKYKRTQAKQALVDLDAWIATMRIALPVREEKD